MFVCFSNYQCTFTYFLDSVCAVLYALLVNFAFSNSGSFFSLSFSLITALVVTVAIDFLVLVSLDEYIHIYIYIYIYLCVCVFISLVNLISFLALTFIFAQSFSSYTYTFTKLYFQQHAHMKSMQNTQRNLSLMSLANSVSLLESYSSFKMFINQKFNLSNMYLIS